MSIWSFLTQINGSDAFSTYGLQASELKGPWDSPSASFPEVAIPGREGATRTTSKPVVATKDFTATYRLIGSGEQDYEDKVDAVRGDLWGSTITFIVGSQEARQRTGLVTDVRVTSDPDTQAGTIAIDVHCSDPIASATSATTTTGSSATDVAMPLGRWLSRPVITIGSSPTSPLVLTYKSYGGTTLGTLTVSYGGSPSSVVVDCEAQTITVGGTRHDEDMTAGDFFALDPHDGVYALSHWPTVRCSSGALSVVYTKRYP